MEVEFLHFFVLTAFFVGALVIIERRRASSKERFDARGASFLTALFLAFAMP
jgi:hypothetical protein